MKLTNNVRVENIPNLRSKEYKRSNRAQVRGMYRYISVEQCTEMNIGGN